MKKQLVVPLSTMRLTTPTVFLLACVAMACHAIRPVPSATSASSSPEVSIDSLFTLGEALGKLDNRALRELSGLVASRRYPGYFWTHNDSGDDPRLFLLNDRAELVATCMVDGAQNRDWEDIAWAPGEAADYLYVGEIGDNEAQYADKFVYRIVEPKVPILGQAGKATLPLDATYTLHFEDGPRDAEGMFVDPLTGELWIVSKREERVGLYAFGVPHEVDVITGKLMTRLDLHQVTAADISTDGTEILIKTYPSVYYWQRLEGQSVVEALSAAPKLLPYHPEPQGEAIAWQPEGLGYYTISELRNGVAPVLYGYQRKP